MIATTKGVWSVPDMKHSSPDNKQPSLLRAFVKSMAIYMGRKLIAWGSGAQTLGTALITWAERE